jgi:hypothetical protein
LLEDPEIVEDAAGYCAAPSAKSRQDFPNPIRDPNRLTRHEIQRSHVPTQRPGKQAGRRQSLTGVHIWDIFPK